MFKNIPQGRVEGRSNYGNRLMAKNSSEGLRINQLRVGKLYWWGAYPVVLMYLGEDEKGRHQVLRPTGEITTYDDFMVGAFEKNWWPYDKNKIRRQYGASDEEISPL